MNTDASSVEDMMSDFPNFLIFTMSSVFVLQYLLALFRHGDFQRCQIGCSCCTCQQSFLFNIFHLLRHSWFVAKYCSVDFHLGLQLGFASKQDPLVILTQRSRLRAQDISNFSGDDRTERVWPSFLELSFANFERRPWSQNCSCVALRTCCHRLSSSPPHTAPHISRDALERRRNLERRHTPSMRSFLGPLMVWEISARNASIGGVATNHSPLSDPLNYLATNLLRYLVPLSRSTHLSFRCVLPVLPALSNKLLVGHVHFVVILHLKLSGFLDLLRVERLSSVIVPCLIEQIIVWFFRMSTVLKIVEVRMRILHVQDRKYLCCLLHLCCSCIPQEISLRKSSIHFSREVRGIFCFRWDWITSFNFWILLS